MHIHMLLCCLQSNDEIYNIPRCQSVEDTIEEDAAKEDYVSRQNTKQLYSNFQLPYKVETTTLAKNNELDCKALLGEGGWPDVFEPSEMCCGLRKSELSASRTHPGSNGKGILITFLNPFLKISIKVKICRERSCQGMHRVLPTHNGKYVYYTHINFCHYLHYFYNYKCIQCK